MKRGKELLANTAIIAIGNFGTKILSFFLLPLYTSLLSAKDYGVYDLLVTISTFIVPFITLLMEESMFRFLIDCKNENEKKSIITQTLVFCILNIILFSVIFLIIGIFVDIPHKIIFYLYVISNVVVSLKNSLARGTSNIKIFAISNFASSFIIIILNVLFIAVLKMGISSLLLSFVIGNLLVSVLVFIKLNFFEYISFKDLNKSTMNSMVKYSIPLVPNSLSWTIVNLSDRIVISSILGTAANGIYSISCKFPTLMNTIYGFFYTAWKEAAAKSSSDNDAEEFYNKIYRALKDFMWAVVIMMISVMPFVFNLLIKKDFVDAYIYIPILVLAMYFSNISGYYGGIFTAYKDTKIMGITTIFAAVINIVVNILLIKMIGIWAAAISTLAATSSIYIYRNIKMRKYVQLKENKMLTFLSVISLILSFVSYYSENLLIQIMIFIILGIYCCYINKDIFLIIKSVLLKKKKLNN